MPLFPNTVTTQYEPISFKATPTVLTQEFSHVRGSVECTPPRIVDEGSETGDARDQLPYTGVPDISYHLSLGSFQCLSPTSVM
jgi:hypothetical protein